MFKPNLFNRKVFRKFYGSVATRCFGYGVPYTCMIPMADFQNHSDRQGNSYEVINTVRHVQPDLLDKEVANNTYFGHQKFLNNYELVFSPQDAENYPA